MSDLYRRTRQECGVHDYTPIGVEKGLGCQCVYVKVVPDYEAALIAFKKFWDQPFYNGDDLAMTKAAVDAALEGDNDEPV